ncbi:hypothetical protein [Sulfurimonas sp.]|uniref:hypothetical protein n=1 Tax=Sulfurimonas sp. TaxID=2022749 RepID=UPI0025F1F269|nr:hypothetical protein [Sulfurimonas sp.]MDD5158105.1 hypothetical protein [Sulfurimonas sp.]
MKTTNYRLQTEIENLKEGKEEWFKNYVRQVLESDKPYYAKADYLGLSIQELQNKIDYLSEDIKELTALKKRLVNAKELSLQAIASVIAEYGIERLDGTAISSITITPSAIKSKETFKILDAQALIDLGYYTVIVDEDAVKNAMLTLEGMNEIDKYIEVGVVAEEVPARIKVNTRRMHTNNQAAELLSLAEQAA